MLKKKILYLNSLLIIIYLAINSKIGYNLNGLPWNNKIETFIILCLIPILFLIYKEFIKSKIIFFFLLFLIFIKSLSGFLFVQSGLKFDAYSDLDQQSVINTFSNFDSNDQRIVEKDEKKEIKFQKMISKLNTKFKNKNFLREINVYKTFNSFWNKHSTYIVNKNIKNKEMFPLDWARGIEIEEWRSLSPTFNINGFAQLYKNEVLIIVSKGANININENNYKNRVFFTSSLKDLIQNNNFDKNIYNHKSQIELNDINFSYTYKSDWSFEIYLFNTKNNKLNNAFNFNRIHIDEEKYFKYSNFYKSSFVIVLISEIFFLLFLFFWILRGLLLNLLFIKSIIPFKFGILLTIISFILPIIIYEFIINIIFVKLNFTDGSYVSPLGFYYLLIFPILYYVSLIKIDLDFKKIKIIILIFLISPSVIYFSTIFSYQIETVFNYPLSHGDDWGTIFNLAKIMSIYNDFVPARYCLHDINNALGYEFINYIKIDDVRDYFCDNNLGSIYHHNPLYRFFVLALLTLFGHGNFSIYILDVWCIMVAVLYCSSLLNKTKLNINYIYLFILIYFIINFIGPSRFLLGRGKEEFLGMAFIILAAGFLYNSINKKKIYLFYGIILGIIAVNIRLDKLFIVIPLISFYFEPVLGKAREIYVEVVNIFIKYYKIIFIYTSLILFSLIFLFIRHFIILGEFYFVHPSSYAITVGIERDRITSGLKSIYYVLSSADFWPDKPKFPSIILFGGSIYLISLMFYRHKSIYKKIPPSLSLATLTILVSFFFFEPSAYPPRWSTHLLPLSTIGFVYFIYNIKKVIILNKKIK